jgi:alpha-tubulin suppressor-like RCC1 family protein
MNDYGQVGNGPSGAGMYSAAPIDVIPSSSDVTDIALSPSHTCALFSSGAVKCWGLNNFGQLGNGSNRDANSPVTAIAAGASGATAISLGLRHSCAIVNGGVQCWGDNAMGVVGDGTTTARNSPTTVLVGTSPLSGATAIYSADYHSCAVASGGLLCWGFNSSGQVGNNSTSNAWTAQSVIAASSVVTAVTGSYANTCAVVNGAVNWWGHNPGDGSSGSPPQTPVPVSGLSSGYSGLFMSYGSTMGGYVYFSCAASSSAIKCWGYNASGQLGDTTTTDQASPVTVSGIP